MKYIANEQDLINDIANIYSKLNNIVICTHGDLDYLSKKYGDLNSYEDSFKKEYIYNIFYEINKIPEYDKRYKYTNIMHMFLMHIEFDSKIIISDEVFFKKFCKDCDNVNWFYFRTHFNTKILLYKLIIYAAKYVFLGSVTSGSFPIHKKFIRDIKYITLLSYHNPSLFHHFDFNSNDIPDLEFLIKMIKYYNINDKKILAKSIIKKLYSSKNNKIADQLKEYYKIENLNE